MHYLLGNWKMYLGFEESIELARQLQDKNLPDEIVSAIFPNPVSFCKIEQILSNSEFGIGAQNVAWTPKGAYTGATSAYLYNQAGAEYALVGHSERRHIFGESNQATAKKVSACIEEGITPILCIGETKKELDGGDRELVLGEQISQVFEHGDISQEQLKEVIIGYEPVWAISGSGEGKACTPEKVMEINSWIKEKITQYTESEPNVVYGGSVDEENILSYLKLAEVDGILLGHASANYQQFSSIISQIKDYV